MSDPINPCFPEVCGCFCFLFLFIFVRPLGWKLLCVRRHFNLACSPFLVCAAGDVLKRHSIRSSLRMSLSPLDRVLWKKSAQGGVHEVRNVALCSSLDFVFPLCIPFCPSCWHIRDPISRVDTSASWLCHFGEKPFSLCVCLGGCVSRVFQHELLCSRLSTSGNWDQSQWQTVSSCWSCRQCNEQWDWTESSISAGHAHERSALVCWREKAPLILFQLVRLALLAGDGCSQNAAQSHTARRAHTPGGTRGKSRGSGFTQ